MPTKKETPAKSTETSEQAPTVAKRKFKLPRIPQLSSAGFLVVCLVIFSFLLGMLTNKVMYLEKMNATADSQPAQGDVAQGPTSVPPPDYVAVTNGKLPLLGDDSAKVTVVEFSDFQCPFCKKYVDETMSQLKEKYIDTGKIKFAFRHSPLTMLHPNATKAGEASECANEQGNFWGYHDELFNTQDTWSPKTGDSVTTAFVEIAGDTGLDTTQFQSCLESGKYADTVAADLKDAQSAQVDGTPTFFINGNRLIGAVPFTELAAAIDKELNK